LVGRFRDDADRVPEAYAQNYAKLSALKALYDPHNRFRHNHNIRGRFFEAAG
jgi:FAD/FMN-containing dehydrogenase